MVNDVNTEIQHLTGQEALNKVRDLLRHFRSTMMVTTVNGKPHARPMTLYGSADQFDGDIWFFTDRECRKVEEIEAEPSVSLIFQSNSDNTFMHLSGQASVIDDLAKKKELYTPVLKTWFPEGLSDPRMTMIRFRAERGDFWDSPGGMVQAVAAFTKSVVTGTWSQSGEMGEVRL